MRPGAPLALLLCLAAAAGCGRNWDLLEPEERSADDRSFTPLGEATPGPLTGGVARERLQDIQAARGQERLDLVESFLADFREARMIPQVHRAAAEAYLATGRPAEAADAFERALVLTRTDLLGLPLETDLPLQLALSALAAGDRERGLGWLARTTIADRGPRVQQAVAWAHAEVAPGRHLEEWLAEIREEVLPQAPTFELPGFRQPVTAIPDPTARATIVNFWSPT